MHSLRVACRICAITVLMMVGCSRQDVDQYAGAASQRPEAKRATELSNYKGKVVLLNFWETWCAPCRIEIPWFIEFEQQYQNRGVAVLGVALDDAGWDNYRILLGSDEVTQLYGGVEALPTTFTVDREGRVASTHIGLISKSDYRKEVEQLLAPVRRSGTAGRHSIDCAC